MPARVLVVSAQPQFQVQVGNVLRHDGHEILVGNDGAEGLRRWAAERPDLIALESELPDTTGLELVARVRQAEAAGTAGSHTPVIVFGSSNDVDSKVRALRAGGDDYLAKPIHPQELSARVRGLLARFARAPQPVVLKPSVGRIHAYYGAKGGVGTTTLAINTAIALQREQKRTVALVDANLQFGDHRVFLDMGPDKPSIVDIINTSGYDADVVKKFMVHHESGVDLLLAPSSPEAAELVDSEQHHLLHVVELLKTMYDYVIVDTDKRLDDNTLDVIGVADRMVVVMTADLSCLKNVRLVLATMKSVGLPDERLMLLLNRSNAFTGVSAKSVESVLRRRISQQIGNDYRSAISSLNSGTPFMIKRPDSALGRGVLEFARKVDQEVTFETAEEVGRLEMVPALSAGT